MGQRSAVSISLLSFIWLEVGVVAQGSVVNTQYYWGVGPLMFAAYRKFTLACVITVNKLTG